MKTKAERALEKRLVEEQKKMELANNRPTKEAVQNLTSMGFDSKKAYKALVEFPHSSEDAVAYVLNHDFASDDTVDLALKHEQEDRKQKVVIDALEGKVKKNNSERKGRAREIPIQLRRLFARLQHLDQQSISTNDLTESFGWNHAQVNQQHDISEMNRILMRALSKSLVKTSHEHLVSDIFKGALVSV